MQHRYGNMIGGFAGLGVLIALILTPTPYHAQGQNAQILEYKCVEFSEEVLYGKLRKAPLK